MYVAYENKVMTLKNETGTMFFDRTEILDIQYKVSRIIDIMVNIEDVVNKKGVK